MPVDAHTRLSLLEAHKDLHVSGAENSDGAGRTDRKLNCADANKSSMRSRPALPCQNQLHSLARLVGQTCRPEIACVTRQLI